MDKLGPDERAKAATKGARSKDKKAATGEKHSRIENRSIERDRIDRCRRDIVVVLRQREKIDAEIRRIIIHREEILQLNDFTEAMRSRFDEIVELVNEWNFEEFNNDELVAAHQALLREVTKMQKFMIRAKGEIGWMRTMLVGSETSLNLQKRECEAVYEYLSDVLTVIAEPDGSASQSAINYLTGATKDSI